MMMVPIFATRTIVGLRRTYFPRADAGESRMERQGAGLWGYPAAVAGDLHNIACRAGAGFRFSSLSLSILTPLPQ